MDDYILITELNDYVFCPISIYFHKLYGNMDKRLFQDLPQINGTKAHETVDTKSYAGADVIKALDVYSDVYRLAGKIDIYDKNKKSLSERKKHVNVIYDGYIFQLYAQYYCMTEMGYEVEQLSIYSIDDNKKYNILLPEENPEMKDKFESVINEMREFDYANFSQSNALKCCNCIYEPSCDRSLKNS